VVPFADAVSVLFYPCFFSPFARFAISSVGRMSVVISIALSLAISVAMILSKWALNSLN
jgi:hypothetical protein